MNPPLIRCRRFSFISRCAFFVVFVLASLAAADDAARQTIFQEPQFLSQVKCVRDCIVSQGTTGACWTDRVAVTIECENVPGCVASLGGGTPWAARNSCYCRTDLQTAAQSAISSCVRTACAVGGVGDMNANLAGGSLVYREYCDKVTASSGGNTSPPMPTGAPTQTVPLPSSATTRPTSKEGSNTTPAPTGAAPSSPPSPSGQSESGLNQAAIIGIAASFSAVFVALVTLWVQWCSNFRHLHALRRRA
ncbi:hypothetical protein B0H63DRAFT_463371 [Podospora didyma]|uniref:Extracellular membrane protein CFEM domain-containing protein n=1 Tax=Podospora didyma TaxID=330526 RepID=A0AAE0NWV9_9PEZI|nr:hypothetical protein B0H63DRAFT_463371 [Podospora didyma]